MDRLLKNLDWSLLRAFLSVAQTGSLSAAARQMGASQPTIGRHIQTMEAQLGVTLFQRHAKGFNLTQTGAELLPYAQAMEDAAQKLALIASGEQSDLAGTVRLTASVIVANYVLPPILADLRQQEPGITLELVASDRSDNLLFREADIAVRMYRPTQLDLTALHIGDLPIGAYAAATYLDRVAAPVDPSDLLTHDLVGFDRDDTILRAMRLGGLAVTDKSFVLRTDHPTVYWEFVRAGGGIGFGQVGIAERDPTLRRILPDLPIPPLELWLTAPVQTRHTPRMARVWDHLKSALQEHIGRKV